MVAEVMTAPVLSRLREQESAIYAQCVKAKAQFSEARTQSQRLEALITMYAGKLAAPELREGERIAQQYTNALTYNPTALFVHLFAEGSRRMKEWGTLDHTFDPDALRQECEKIMENAVTPQQYAVLIAKLSAAMYHAYAHPDIFTNGRQIQKQFEDCYRNADKHELVESLINAVARDEVDAQLLRWANVPD